jgi:multidrug efflux pump subunit AcrA (membrane-fusion protein)
VEAYRVGVAAAQKQLDMCTIKAPEAGVILEKRIVPGQLITPQAVPVLFVLTPNPDDLELAVQVNESDILHVKEGMEAEVRVDALSSENPVFRGKVSRISLTPTTPGMTGLRLPIGPAEGGNLWSMPSGMSSGPVSYTVTLKDFQSLPPQQGRRPQFKLGMTANVDLIVVRDKVLRIPNEAFRFLPRDLPEKEKEQIRAQETATRKPVWVWIPNGRGGRMELRWVTIHPEATDGTYTQVEEGGELQEGMQVVVGENSPPQPRTSLFQRPLRFGPN